VFRFLIRMFLCRMLLIGSSLPIEDVCVIVLRIFFVPIVLIPVRVCAAVVLCLRTWKLVSSALNRLLDLTEAEGS